MVDKETVIKTIQQYDALIARAIALVGKAPYWQWIPEESACRLGINGEEATLYWGETDFSYDVCGLTVEQTTFPARLLILSDREFQAWQHEEKTKYDEEEARRREARIQAKAAEERALFDSLKRKYEHI